MQPVFPILYLGTRRTRRTLVTTPITPSLVAKGEPNMYPTMYQLYLYAAYQPLLNIWSASPLLRHEGVTISLLNANTRLWYWPRSLVIQIVDDITLGPTSEVRHLFILSWEAPLITCRPRSFFFLSIRYLYHTTWIILCHKTHVDDLCPTITFNILIMCFLSLAGGLGEHQVTRRLGVVLNEIV